MGTRYNRIMKFLRHCLFALILLRLFAGTAWAMPTMPTMPIFTHSAAVHAHVDHVDMPCHEHEQAEDTDNTAPCHSLLCQLCCMGYVASVPVLDTPIVLPRHAPPSHPAQNVARWQHTPDLRPPI